jgi:hypothetical protein
MKLDWIGELINMAFLQVPEDEPFLAIRSENPRRLRREKNSASGRGGGIIFDAPLENSLSIEDIDAEDAGRVFEDTKIVLQCHPVVLEERERKRACQFEKKEPVVFGDLVLRLVKNLVFQKDITESQGKRKDQD